MNLSTLSNNLQNIYAALAEDTPSLVADASCTLLYNSGCGSGIFWELFYVFSKEEKHKNLELTIVKTKEAFESMLKPLQEDLKSYQKVLGSYIESGSLDEESYHEKRSLIANWSRMLLPFLEQLEGFGREKLETFFQSCLKEKTFRFGEMIPKELKENLAGFQAVIDLENILEAPIPKELLQWVFPRSEITKKEELALKEWLEKVDRSQEVDASLFHKALKMLVVYTQKHLQPRFKTFYTLPQTEWKLATYGLKKIQEASTEHSEWRNALQPGDRFSIKGQVFTLKARLGKKLKKEDDLHTYSLKETDKKIIAIAKNCALLPMIQAVPSYSLGALTTHPFSFIEENGMFACASKGICYTDDIWTGKDCCSKQDMALAAPLIQAIRQMIKEQFIPAKFEAKYLILESSNLKYLRFLHRKDFDLDHLKQVLLEISQGKAFIFDYIAKHAGL